MKVFSIGCVYFGYANLSLADHADSAEAVAVFRDIEKRLENVENVSEIVFDPGYSDLELSLAVIPRKDKEIYVPIFGNGARISFDLFLPFRIQDSIYSRCDVEHIHIDIIYGYEMPILIASYDWPDEEGDASPSQAIVVTRKYLEKKISDDLFYCDCVGPSPFHSEFALITSDLITDPTITDVSSSRLGYASLELSSPLNGDLVNSIIAANLDDTFSLFYHLSGLRSRIIHTHTTVVDSARQLLDGAKPSSIFKRFRFFREQAKSVDAINTQLFQEMLLRLDMSNALLESDRSELTGEKSSLNVFFDEYRSIASADTWSKFTDIAKFFEERRQKALGNYTSIFAGITGGVIGSVIGSLATYLLTKT
jgi:hypothetical protein